MRPTAQIHAVVAMRFWEVTSRFQQGKLSCEQAADLMGVSISTFLRKRKLFAEDGEVAPLFGQERAVFSPPQNRPRHPHVEPVGPGLHHFATLEQFHFEIALAATRVDARREGASAIYLRG